MEAETIANRYAQAIFEVVDEKNYDQLIDEFQVVCDALLSDNLLHKFFSSPIVPDKSKKKTLDEILKKAELLPEFESFLSILLIKERIVLLSKIRKALIKIIEVYRNIDTVVIYAPFDMSEADKLKIVEKLSIESGKKLKCKVVKDPSLIGGIIAQVGHHIYDLSLKSKLEKIGTQLENKI